MIAWAFSWSDAVLDQSFNKTRGDIFVPSQPTVLNLGEGFGYEIRSGLVIFTFQKLSSRCWLIWSVVSQYPGKRFERSRIEVVPRELGRCRHSGVFRRSQGDEDLDSIIPRILLKFAPLGQKDLKSRSLPRVPWSSYEESMGA